MDLISVFLIAGFTPCIALMAFVWVCDWTDDRADRKTRRQRDRALRAALAAQNEGA